MKAIAIIKYVFSLIGLGLLAGALFWYQSTSEFLGRAVSAPGVVTDLIQSRSSDSTTYRPAVSFVSQTGETVEFVSSAGSNPPSYSRGERVEVLYLPDEPESARINGFFSLWGGPVILGGIGSVFFLIGAGILLAGMLGGRREAYLRQHGTPIETEYQRVERNGSLTVNGRNPFRVVTQWLNPETLQVHVFHSANLWFDPTDYIGQKHITVFIEKGNPKKYFVDLSFLPKLAE